VNDIFKINVPYLLTGSVSQLIQGIKVHCINISPLERRSASPRRCSFQVVYTNTIDDEQKANETRALTWCFTRNVLLKMWNL